PLPAGQLHSRSYFSLFASHRVGVAVVTTVAGDLVAQALGMRKPDAADVLGNAVGEQGLLENALAPAELTTHDRVRRVGRLERSSAINDRSAEELGGVLVLELLDVFAGHLAEEKADHHIVEDAVDEVVDDAAERRLAAQAVECGGHDGPLATLRVARL